MSGRLSSSVMPLKWVSTLETKTYLRPVTGARITGCSTAVFSTDLYSFFRPRRAWAALMAGDAAAAVDAGDSPSIATMRGESDW